MVLVNNYSIQSLCGYDSTNEDVLFSLKYVANYTHNSQVDENCEEWPVQKCTLGKKTVRKVHPETECRKIPREVCVPNNCAMQQGEQICRDEVRMQVQNVPQEECELQPEENCHAEAVLVPR